MDYSLFPYGILIYSIDTILYPYTLLLIHLSYSHLKSLPKYNLSSTSKGHNKDGGMRERSDGHIVMNLNP